MIPSVPINVYLVVSIYPTLPSSLTLTPAPFHPGRVGGLCPAAAGNMRHNGERGHRGSGRRHRRVRLQVQTHEEHAEWARREDAHQDDRGGRDRSGALPAFLVQYHVPAPYTPRLCEPSDSARRGDHYCRGQANRASGALFPDILQQRGALHTLDPTLDPRPFAAPTMAEPAALCSG